MKEREKKARRIESALRPRKGSLAKKLVSSCFTKGVQRSSRQDFLTTSLRRSIARHDELRGKKQQRFNMRQMKEAASMASQSIYGTVFLSLLPVIGVTLFALTVSWNTMPIEIYPGMIDILKVFTVNFQALYAIIAIFVWDFNGILSYVDLVICTIAPFADWYWSISCAENGTLLPVDILTYSLLTLYMTARLWAMAVVPLKLNFHRSVNRGAVYKVDKLNFVWTTRSASQVSEILPDILVLYDLLVTIWGFQCAQEVCQISIFVTDKDAEACSLLRRELQPTSLFQAGSIIFAAQILQMSLNPIQLT